INQNRYSIFDRTIEKNGLKATARTLGKGIIAFSPLAQGLLTDRYLNGLPDDSRAVKSGKFLKPNDITDSVLQKVNALNQIAKEHGCSLSQLALKWVLKDSDLTSVLIGASRPSQIIDNAGIVGIAPLSEEELSVIERVVGA
ncbi:MAG: aldo/keto reductase, partial [Bacteroidales bacterium]|nr:aldo/keto reductase [Bacteroidales bacterium]